MLLKVKYLLVYMTVITGLYMCVLMSTICIASDYVGLSLLITMISVMATVLSLIRINHPPAPPYKRSLLFRQVRITHGLTHTITNIDDNEAFANKTVEVGYLLPLKLLTQ